MESRMTLHIEKVVAQWIAKSQVKWSQDMEAQVEWMLKAVIQASAACTDVTANELLSRIDCIGQIFSGFANLEYNHPPADGDAG